MAYDAAMGREVRRTRLDFLSAPDAPWKARQLAALTVVAAGLIVFDHLLSALFDHYRPVRTLISADPRLLTSVNLALACVAALLASLAHHRGFVWVAIAVLIWSAWECFPFFTYRLYGHGAMPKANVLGLIGAIAGVRGAMALRRFGGNGSGKASAGSTPDTRSLNPPEL